MKRIFLMLLFLFFLSGLMSCTRQTEQDITEKEENNKAPFESQNSEMEEKKFLSGDVILITEYDVEDYMSGCFIISKNNGRLYGVTDITGKEILPVKYDKISFLNEKNVKNGVNDELLILAKYEGQNYVYDTQGNEIVCTDEQIICYTQKSKLQAYFLLNDKKEHVLKFYDKKGACISKIEYNGYDDVTFYPISDKCSVAWAVLWKQTQYGARVEKQSLVSINSNFEIVENFWGAGFISVKSGNEVDYLYILDVDGIYKKIGLNEDAKKYSITEFSSKNDLLTDAQNSNLQSNDRIELGKNMLYMSNNTWKLVNENGVSLYDERYYKCGKRDDTFLLANEDDEICVINNKGEIVIGYGCLKFVGENVYYNEMPLYTDNYIVGDDAIVIIIKKENKNYLYYYFNEKYKNNLLGE